MVYVDAESAELMVEDFKAVIGLDLVTEALAGSLGLLAIHYTLLGGILLDFELELGLVVR